MTSCFGLPDVYLLVLSLVCSSFSFPLIFASIFLHTHKPLSLSSPSILIILTCQCPVVLSRPLDPVSSGQVDGKTFSVNLTRHYVYRKAHQQKLIRHIHRVSNNCPRDVAIAVKHNIFYFHLPVSSPIKCSKTEE